MIQLRGQLINFTIVSFFCIILLDFRPLIFGQNDGIAVKNVVKNEKEGLREKKLVDDFTSG